MNWTKVTMAGLWALAAEAGLFALIVWLVVLANDRKLWARATAVVLAIAAIVGLVAGSPLTVSWG